MGKIPGRFTRAVWAALVAACMLAVPAGAQTAASAELSRLATASRGDKAAVVVYCAGTQADWAGTLASRGIPSYVVGFAYIGDDRLWLSPSICAGVTRADPWAVLVFLHELGHTTGVRSERAANCRALAAERRFLIGMLGLDAAHAQSIYEASLAKAMAEPPRYRPVRCS